MKKFLKKIPVFLAAFAVLVCSVFAFPASAAEFTYEVMPVSSCSYENVMTLDGNFRESYFCISPAWFGDVEGMLDPNIPGIPSGRYVVRHKGDDYTWPFGGIVGDPSSTPAQVVIYSNPMRCVSFGEEFDFNAETDLFFIAQVPVNAAFPQLYRVVENEPSAPLYQSAWDLFVQFIYGEGVELTPDQTLTLTLLSTLAVLLLVALPFLIIFGVIKGLFG